MFQEKQALEILQLIMKERFDGISVTETIDLGILGSCGNNHVFSFH